MGASKVAQLHDSLVALDIQLSPAQLKTLDDASILDPFQDRIWPMLKRVVFGGGSVQGWQ
ncbi:hypothetical protein [Hymenobacter siberiensis]|uniref:hypothetical protein n=1 Tax=Hymenobacter siberiensis TaxID=2848396 RepID=UPI001D015877|nr:hypothetical protein [Hymenobacter siberiensis]